MKLKQIRVDGYKNLINAKLDLGDFNVLVGPNNSGKSNLLEAIQQFLLFCFGNEQMRNAAFTGFPLRTFGTSICHLDKYQDRALSLGITLEVTFRRKKWVVDYDLTVKRSREGNNEAQFLRESLRAKQPQKTGSPRTYLSRTTNKMKVIGKTERKIPKDTSVLSAIKSIYPDFEGLPKELDSFVNAIAATAVTDVFALSPDALRRSIAERSFERFVRIASFDLLTTLDRLHQDETKYVVFKENVCDILDLEDLQFASEAVCVTHQADPDETSSQQARFCFVKKIGDTLAPIDEYSDGTLLVIAILATVLSGAFNGPILCLEELENCLHPLALEKLLRFLQDHAHKCPVLITTHSPYLLNGVNPDDVNAAVVDKTGATHFEKVKSSRDLRDYLNKGLMSFGDLLVSDFRGFREG
ncbi:MAG: AAA family ATPase [Planctomycetota bacterium]|jgi:predicted ATPase